MCVVGLGGNPADNVMTDNPMLTPEQSYTPVTLFGIAALVFTVAIFSTACKRETTAAPQREATPSVQTSAPQRAEMRTVRVSIDGMICMVCAGSVKNALKAVDGVQTAEVSLEKHHATVQYEMGKVSLDELTRVITQLGYKAGVPTPVQSQ
jgi:copper chaperone CopZ